MNTYCIEYITLDELQHKLEALLKKQPNSSAREKNLDDTLLTRAQAAKKLNITLPTLSAWTQQNKLIAYRINRRVYYKIEDILKALIQIKF